MCPKGFLSAMCVSIFITFASLPPFGFNHQNQQKKTSKHRARALSLTLNLCGVQTRATRRPNPSPTPAAAQFAMIPYRVHVGSRNSQCHVTVVRRVDRVSIRSIIARMRAQRTSQAGGGGGLRGMGRQLIAGTGLSLCAHCHPPRRRTCQTTTTDSTLWWRRAARQSCGVLRGRLCRGSRTH